MSDSRLWHSSTYMRETTCTTPIDVSHLIARSFLSSVHDEAEVGCGLLFLSAWHDKGTVLISTEDERAIQRSHRVYLQVKTDQLRVAEILDARKVEYIMVDVFRDQ